MAGEDPARTSWVRRQPCCAPEAPKNCVGRIDPHHAGYHYIGQRAHDDTAVSLCVLHHRQWHDHRGPFLGWDRAQRRQWADERIAEFQAKWAAASEAA